MKRMLLLTILLVATSTAAFGQSVAGTWTASFETQLGTQEYTYIFEVDGTTLSGSATSTNGESEISQGTIDGGEISFVETLNFQGMPLEITYTGTLSGDEIQFTRVVAGTIMEELTATRQ